MESEWKRPNHAIKDIHFGVLSSEEIRSMSVVKIKSPKSFDELGLANPGGPYDPKLGALGREDVCPTCYQMVKLCSGHIGHIDLPVPVYNPMLFKTLLKILKGSCLKCHLLICDPVQVPIFLGQIRLINAGYRELAFDFPGHVQTLLAEQPTLKGKDMHDEILRLVDILQAEYEPRTKSTMDTSNAVADGQFLIKDFLRTEMKANTRCQMCTGKNWVLKAFYDRKVTYTIGAKRGQKIQRVSGLPSDVPTGNKRRRSNSQKEPSSASSSHHVTDISNNEEAEEDVGEPSRDNTPGTSNANDSSQKDVQIALSPLAARDHMRKVWEKNRELLLNLYGVFDNNLEYPVDIFFMDVLLVTPSKFRPLRVMDEQRYAHSQSRNLERLIQMCNNIRILKTFIKGGATLKDVAGFKDVNSLMGKTLEEKLTEAWDRLQLYVNCVADGDADKMNREFSHGVKQILEKKDGLFRMHMMGKRVNFSARSVISPDPYLNLNEIGIPEYFALRLTYPVFVTPANLEDLRQAVINGPDIHPGAKMVESEDGTKVMLKPNDAQQRISIAKSLLVSSSRSGIPKKVHRHLINGDVLLLNRQPTLHKPSIMAHKARVLKGEKTLRLHYANCKSYNADFDGDEMNAHLPQDDVARSEASTMVNASYQYLVPKDGSPLSGLIQDHIVAGVHLTIRGRFFGRADYEQLVIAAIGTMGKSIRFLQPSLLKPQQLWSGKQIISTIVLNLTPEERHPLTLRTSSKVPLKSWQRNQLRRYKRQRFSVLLADERDMTESDVIFQSGELMCGVLDKAQYGPSSFGLVHACFELYGGETSAQLLSSLARLFTFFLQIHGFSLGVEDILVSSKADIKRSNIMMEVNKSGLEVAAKALNLDPDVAPGVLRDAFEKAHRNSDQTDMKVLDGMIKGKVDELNNDITRVCMPHGLYKRFPENQLQTMVLSGAKGATVNCIQMSCLLGQIELEGARPPLMLSGRTLPSFVPYECSPRSGGFVVQRFATGLRPQEYFFHCMAGREGLIDTAVKTSRSGYLQRCIIKHLEGVMVNYDLTVRNSDSTVIQFLYGEDGMDIGKTPFFSDKQLPFLISNVNKSSEKEIRRLKKKIDCTSAYAHDEKVAAWTASAAIATKNSRDGDKRRGRKVCPTGYLSLSTGPSHIADSKYGARVSGVFNDVVEPTMSVHRPDISLGSISEQLNSIMEKYCKNPPVISGLFRSKKSSDQVVRDVVALKYMKSLCQPGEAVGALAGQSIGEPSTQMTLNTFHFAGRGEMNVTLGIPRLREILMTASKKIKTPTMEVPVKPGKEKEAESLRTRLNRVLFGEVVEFFEITSFLEVEGNDDAVTVLELYIKLLPPSEITSKTCLTCGKIMNFFERFIVKQLLDRIRKKETSVRKQTKSGKGNEMDEAVEAKKRGGAEADGGETEVDISNENAEEVNSDDEGADPDAAKAQSAAGAEYTGDQDDEAVREWEHDVEARLDDEDAAEDKENSIYENSEAGDYDDLLRLSKPELRADKKKATKKMNPMRSEAVIAMDSWIRDYKYDPKEESWCCMTLSIPVMHTGVDPQSMIELELKNSVVHQVPSIKKAFLNTEKSQLLLRTEGVNFDYIMRYDHILELNKLFSNDIQAVAERFGIEAAMKTIIRECNTVFGAYGIDVNYRHLSLVADYMTVDGSVKAFNRLALASNASPFQKMSFETSMNFYRDAVINGSKDTLKSPSARLVAGERINVGTGLFSLRCPVRSEL